MTDASPRFSLPFIVPGQAQKEQLHNEALLVADALVHPAVEGGPVATPPAEPAPGECWLVAGAPEGEWAGQNNCLACWTESGWRFIAPVAGMSVWKKPAGLWVHWTGSAWNAGEVPAAALVVDGQQVVGARQPEVPSPSGGTIIDAEARTALSALIVALRSHGLID